LPKVPIGDAAGEAEARVAIFFEGFDRVEAFDTGEIDDESDRLGAIDRHEMSIDDEVGTASEQHRRLVLVHAVGENRAGLAHRTRTDEPRAFETGRRMGRARRIHGAPPFASVAARRIASTMRW